MKNNNYIKLQLSKKGDCYYHLYVFFIDTEGKKGTLEGSNEAAYYKSIKEIKEYLNRNNYNPCYIQEGVFTLDKNIKREKILMNNLKKKIDNNFKFLNCYTVY